MHYILTGTPGSGKTTLINELSNLGHTTVSEAATKIIAEQQALEIQKPWLEPEFISRLLTQQLQDFRSAPTDKPVFFDRSLICTYALCQFLNITPPAALLKAIKNTHYHKQVFFIDNLGFVEQTSARTISYADALKFELLHKDAYQHFGYTLLHIPKAPIDTRIKQILIRV